MAAFSDKFERSVIPRWHDSLAHSFNHEAQSLKAVVRPFAPDTSEIRQELLATGTLAVAVDALNVAVAASDNEMALLAAEIIQTRGPVYLLPSSPPLAKSWVSDSMSCRFSNRSSTFINNESQN